MDILNEFEHHQKLTSELRSLFEFVPPATLRRSLMDLFFSYLTETRESELPNQKQLFAHFYYLINFLEEVEAG